MPHNKKQRETQLSFQEIFPRRERNNAATHSGPANASIETYDFSAEGKRVLFETAASNLVPTDMNRATDIFVRDLQSSQTFLASANTNGVTARNGALDGWLSAGTRNRLGIEPTGANNERLLKC